MAKFLKLTALLAAITALVWGVTIWRWQSTRHLIGTDDVVLYLIALPVLVFALVLLVGWVVARRKAAAASAAPTAAAPAAAVAEAPPPGHALLLDTQLALAIGQDAATALSVLAEGTTQPDLDDELRDDDGFALPSARAKELDTHEAEDALSALLPALATKHPQWQGHTPSASLVRALALLAAPLAATIERCAQHWPAPDAAASQAAPSAPASSAPHGLALVWGLPAAWAEPEQALARTWLAQALKASPLPQDGWHFVVEPMDSAEAVLLAADRQLAAWQQQQRPGLLIALACDSLLDEARVRPLLQRGLLCTAQQPKGCVPGEAAAAALLATPDWPGLDVASAPPTRLHRLAMTRRDKSADAPGRVDATLLRRAAHDAMAFAGQPASEYASLVTDIDLRASRSTELAEAAMPELPDLDATAQSVRLGLACGDVGLAAGLCCVALAAAQVRSENKPVLVLTAMHPHDRAAVALTPLPDPEAASG